MRNATHPNHVTLASVQAKLTDTVELLHLWQNEAHTYRLLAEAVAIGHYSPTEAKRALAKGVFGPEQLRLAFVPLTESEQRTFAAIAAFAGLPPSEFLWSCLDTVLINSDDEDLLKGCAEAARKRFREGELPAWGR